MGEVSGSLIHSVNFEARSLGFSSRGDFARAPEGIKLFPLLWIKEMVDPSLETRVGYRSLLEEPCFRSREFPGSSFAVIALTLLNSDTQL